MATSLRTQHALKRWQRAVWTHRWRTTDWLDPAGLPALRAEQSVGRARSGSGRSSYGDSRHMQRAVAAVGTWLGLGCTPPARPTLTHDAEHGQTGQNLCNNRFGGRPT